MYVSDADIYIKLPVTKKFRLDAQLFKTIAQKKIDFLCPRVQLFMYAYIQYCI
jgi:hypothetical protein